jgi:hypothetical protein
MPKLYKVLVGCTPKGRNTEQHDVFFGIADNVAALVPQLKAFWPEAANAMHIDAIREVNYVDGYAVTVLPKTAIEVSEAQLFFINLGGYKKGEFEEYHYKMVVAATEKHLAIKAAKETSFYKHTGYTGAASHVDDKYGIDVDDIYAIEDILSNELKQQYKIVLTATNHVEQDEYKLGYFKMSKVENGLLESE